MLVAESGQKPAAEGGLSSLCVSVIIPTYNTAKWIGETLDSALAQTLADVELVVVNDGSPDTPELERVLQPYLPRILYLKQENRGPAAARNLGIRHARGEFLAFLDSDDLWSPQYLAQQMKLFDERPSLDMVYSDTRLFGNSRFAGKTFMELYPQRGAATLENLLSGHCTIVTSCAVVRKRAVVEVGMFDESFFVGEDFDLWLRLAHGGARIGYQREVLGRRRIHAGALTMAGDLMDINQSKVLRKLAMCCRLAGEARLVLERRLRCVEIDVESRRGKRCLLSGDLQQAADSFKRVRCLLQEDRPGPRRGGLGRSVQFRTLRAAKLNLVLFGLRFSPSLTRFGVRLWGRFEPIFPF
jgi:Glycosyl transferase family 2